MDLNVKALVCDMGNRGVLSRLGFSLKKNEMIFKIPNPADVSHPLYCLPDMVHVFKSVKEMFCSNRTITLPEEIVKSYNLPSSLVDISHIEQLNDYQQGMDLKMAPKLDESCIKSNHFNKMKVNSSTNVINKTTAGLCLLTATNAAPLDFVTTAFFL